MTNLLFAKWNLPAIDKKAVLSSIIDLPDSCWFYEPYRNTKMLPLSTKNGSIGYKGTTNYQSGDFTWTKFASNIVKEWCNDILFPAMGMTTRIVILKTESFASNNEHIDCDPIHQFSRQHKFRIVLQGRTDSLYFIKDQENIAAPNIEEPFIMDGSWPHGMVNHENFTKYTFTAGAPWSGNENYDNLTVMLKRNDSELPKDYYRYYKNETTRMA